MSKIIANIRYVVLIAVAGLILAGVAAFVYGGIATVHVVYESFSDTEFDADGTRLLSVELIEMIDIFLLGAVLFVIALGLHQLFIDPEMDLPHWLIFENLEQLKATVVVVVIVMLSILFLGQVAEFSGSSDDLLDVGLAIGVFFVGLALVTWVFQRVMVEDEDRLERSDDSD